MEDIKNIRNFCIIAHVDHGKTTLSDRLLERTNTIQKRQMQDQLLDSMDLERERGITIKSHPVSMEYTYQGQKYLLNLIDTPGHVDFSYEVSRSLAACEGAILLVDAAQGVEAQTVANAHLAVSKDLEIIPVINKVDLPSAQPEVCKRQIEDILAIPAEDAIEASGKTGLGTDEILKAVIERIPPPKHADYPATRALIFDCIFDSYKGVICYVRVFSGSLKAGDEIEFMGTGRKTTIKEVGRFTPSMTAEPSLEAGCTGYIVSNVKEVSDIAIGDTVTLSSNPAKDILHAYKPVKPMVFSGIYPVDTSEYEKLKVSIAKLHLNDAALTFMPETSVALGFGFRCGFLGLLHMEIVQERLRREYGLDIISTYPSVVYKLDLTNGEQIEIDNPCKLPDPSVIKAIYEPMIKANIMIPTDSIGDMLALISEKRGLCLKTDSIDETRVMLVCSMPLNEILIDFNDKLKSITRGYGSLDYEMDGYQPSKLVRLDILVNGEQIDAFSSIVHADKSESKGRALCAKLKDILPRQMFKVAIQAAVGGKIIARETIGSFRKDVTAKCYGGDITRKKKLLEKQKEGKKRMKQIGKVSIPQEAFVNVLKSNT